MPRIPLTLACGDYDRTRALYDESVRPEGVSLTCIRLPIEEIFFRMVNFGEFDVAELSLSTYLLTLDDEAQSRFVGIPVFLSRSFRHSGIYINAQSGIERPEDLVGCTIGIPEYQVTAAVWIRGILAEHHGVAVNSVRYRTGGLHETGRVEKIGLNLGADVSVTPISEEQTLSDMLASGDIDALYSPRAPRSLLQFPKQVRQMFDDPRQQEVEYYLKTGIFPIMHIVVLRRDVYERYPWVAQSLQKAFEQARVEAVGALDDVTALRVTLPWLVEEVEQTRKTMAYDYWTYGLDSANAHTIETLVRYSHEQGLARRAYQTTELFAAETLRAVRI